MIKTTAQTVEALFNATVIYGDTDSVMVNFHCGEGPDALAKALELGKVRHVFTVAVHTYVSCCTRGSVLPYAPRSRGRCPHVK